jgi:Protein of unknown function (DUF2783)
MPSAPKFEKPTANAEIARMRIDPNIPDPDGFYAALVAAHQGLTEAQSAELSAKLVFLLANQLGDQRTLLECIEAAVASPNGSAARKSP